MSFGNNQRQDKFVLDELAKKAVVANRKQDVKKKELEKNRRKPGVIRHQHCAKHRKQLNIVP